MNAIDLLFILLLLAGLAIGFFQGTIRLTIAIVSFYVSIVLASLYFQLVGRFFRQRFGTTLEVGQITAFAVILLIAFLLLTIAGLYTFRYARMPAALDFLDRIVGTLLGLVLGALILGIFASLLESLFVFRNPGGVISFPIMRAFQGGVRSSILVSFFANTILPLIYAAVRPVLPAEADLIFRVR
ncbi:MAG: CvpA family protein [Chloroflexota bacterium]|nr:MAG: colicin V production protein [Chloroflexota bacterium]